MPEPVKAQAELLQKLRDRIKARQVIVVVGSGISIQATGNAEAASWKGLLRSGIRRCREHDAEACFRALAVRGNARQGLELFSKLDQAHAARRP